MATNKRFIKAQLKLWIQYTALGWDANRHEPLTLLYLQAGVPMNRAHIFVGAIGDGDGSDMSIRPKRVVFTVAKPFLHDFIFLIPLPPSSTNPPFAKVLLNSRIASQRIVGGVGTVHLEPGFSSILHENGFRGAASSSRRRG